MSENHTVGFKTCLTVLTALLFLTVVTVAVAQWDFGAWNTFIAMLIASVKGALVLLYFMHLKYEDKLYWVVFGSGVFFIVVLFFLIKVDVITRVLETNTL